MRVAIFGRRGRLARALASQLTERGHDILLVASSDVLNGNFTRSLDAFRPQKVVNAIALTDVDLCEDSPDLSHQINVEIGARIALDSAYRRTQFIQISSDFVFDSKDNVPIPENARPSPIQTYGMHKHKLENLVSEVGFDTCVVRVSSLYSPLYGGFLSNALKLLSAEKPVKAAVDITSTPVSFEIAAKLLCAGLERGFPQGIVHISPHGSASKFDSICFAAAVVGLPVDNLIPVSQIDLGLLAKRPEFSVLSPSPGIVSSDLDWKSDLRKVFTNVP